MLSTQRQNFVDSFATRFGPVERKPLSASDAQVELNGELKRIDRIKGADEQPYDSDGRANHVDVYSGGGGMLPPTRLQGLLEPGLYQGAEHIHLTSITTPSLTTTYLGQVAEDRLVRHQVTHGLGDVRRETLVIDRKDLSRSYKETEVFSNAHGAPVKAARDLDRAHFAEPLHQVDGWMSLNIPGC